MLYVILVIMKRIFLALKAKIDDYDRLQSNFEEVIKGRWVPEENLHVTVCYFGDLYEVDYILQKMPLLNDKLREFKVSSLGYFKHNNILYAKAKSQELETLQSSICRLYSLPTTKPFIVHVTLMRIKEIQDKDTFSKLLEEYKDKTLGIVNPRFELMQSRIQHPGGAKYESIRKY